MGVFEATQWQLLGFIWPYFYDFSIFYLWASEIKDQNFLLDFFFFFFFKV